MPRLAIYRSMHNVRPGERHRPARVESIDAAAAAYLALCDLELGAAWSGDRLTEIRRRMESEANLLRAYALEAECKAAGRASVDDTVRARVAERLASDARHRAVRTFVELAREAESRAMTLVYDNEP